MKVWLGAVGGPERPTPDIHVSCPKGCDAEVSSGVFRVPDIDLDGSLIGVIPCPTLGSECSGLDALVEELQRRIEAGEFIIDPNDPRVSPPCAQGNP